MKSFLPKLFIAGCLMAVISIAWSGAIGQEGKKKGQKGDPTANLRAKLERSNLPADVKEKVEKILAAHAPKLREAQAKVNEATTREQKQAAKAARKAAQDAGKKGKAVQEEAVAAMKLTPEQREKYEAAQSELQSATQAMNRELRSVLTEEQQAALGVQQKGKKKKKAAN